MRKWGTPQTLCFLHCWISLKFQCYLEFIIFYYTKNGGPNSTINRPLDTVSYSQWIVRGSSHCCGCKSASLQSIHLNCGSAAAAAAAAAMNSAFDAEKSASKHRRQTAPPDPSSQNHRFRSRGEEGWSIPGQEAARGRLQSIPGRRLSTPLRAERCSRPAKQFAVQHGPHCCHSGHRQVRNTVNSGCSCL